MPLLHSIPFSEPVNRRGLLHETRDASAGVPIFHMPRFRRLWSRLQLFTRLVPHGALMLHLLLPHLCRLPTLAQLISRMVRLGSQRCRVGTVSNLQLD
jgi:hypothetical protein